MQFLISNITPEWMDLVESFPEFIFELSPDVEYWFEESRKLADERNLPPLDKTKWCNLRYSFECDIGWKPIIWEYFTNIKNIIDNARANGDEVFYKTCIFKEKFGELRDQGDFYGKDHKKYLSEYTKLSLDLMEKSSKVCEICGKDGRLRTAKRGWWIKCLCEDHAVEKEFSELFH